MEIEKDIPIPDIEHNPSRKYPFHKMQVGDSILDTNAYTSEDSKMYMAAKVDAHRKGTKYSARKVKGGVRIWRVA